MRVLRAPGRIAAGAFLDEVGLMGERHALFGEGVGEIVEGLEGRVGDRFVGRRPEPFGGLQFGRVGRQEAELEALWHHQLLGNVPAGIVEHQDDRILRTG